ncbi:putative FBD-associated F-box protein At5g38570 [Triticum dicoccoides]|uniref:putative FBD-associated F-box protein At5g38570 n=1 Tax=Triticum dicoccoides TaxID=85692 RepID=UPI001890E711|nr:putative FBD-associated F-box protein At5g38570 [Triticum dicoccoides]
MPPRKKRKSAPALTVVSAPDHISALPDSMLHHVLSFLPVQAAVRTCVLARRWRHLWRSTTGLRIVGLDDKKHLRNFMHHLLVLRERTDLDTVEIKLGVFVEEDQTHVNLWTRFAVMCSARALTLHVSGPLRLYLDDLPLVSRHLRTLDLHDVDLPKSFIDFAGCPALEGLKMNLCSVSVGGISSCSLRHLSITGCHFGLGRRVIVSAPGLVSLILKLVGSSDTKTPCLESMASLETARVYLGLNCADVCLNYDDSGHFCGANDKACNNCVPIKDDGSGDAVLLGGISSATHLELRSLPRKFIFARDLKHCPTFNKLKSLLLNEYWCEAPGLDPLLCILKNSPVLEKLTLQLFLMGQNNKLHLKGSYKSMERPSAISRHLNIVEVKCDVVEERIYEVIKLLCAALNIREQTNDTFHAL